MLFLVVGRCIFDTYCFADINMMSTGLLCTYSLQRILAALEHSPKAYSDAYLFAFVTFVTIVMFTEGCGVMQESVLSAVEIL